MSNRKLRPLGQITADLEPLLFEMVCQHDLQHGEVLALIDVWLSIHAPACKEKYTDGSPSPVMIYTAPKGFKNGKN